VLAIPVAAVAQGVQAKYDRFAQQTRVTVAAGQSTAIMFHGQSAAPLVRSVKIVAGFTCPGETQGCTPKAAEIVFIGDTADWAFSSLRTLKFLVDGVPIDAGRYSWDGSVYGAYRLAEYMSVEVPPETLMKLAKAKQVEAQLGVYEFTFTAENIEALRALAARLPGFSSPGRRRRVDPASSDGPLAR